MMLSTKERARGRWRQILPAFGIAGTFLTGRNVPCPMCGGRDRFRFIDRLDADGMWLCNQCQPRPRPAIDLAVAYSGRPFRETARVIDDILGEHVVPMVRRAPPDDTAKSIARAKTCWHRGAPVRHDDVVDRYLRHRGVGLDRYPACLRTSKRAIGKRYELWPPLKPATIARKLRGNTPLLETGELRDSIEWTASGLEGQVGSNNDKAVWHELGTSHIPPRSFLASSAISVEEKIHRMAERSVIAVLEGRGLHSAEMRELLHLLRHAYHNVREAVETITDEDDENGKRR